MNKCTFRMHILSTVFYCFYDCFLQPFSTVSTFNTTLLPFACLATMYGGSLDSSCKYPTFLTRLFVW
jgi:hypothetical protein